jgi:hypothetical protein
MATAKHLHFHLRDSSPHNIDVYSTPVAVYEGETFNWKISGQDGQASVTVEPVPGQSWPFSQSSFAVSLGNGTQATVNSGTASPTPYQFQCSPAAPTTPQDLYVAKVYQLCDTVSVKKGQYFAWQNPNNAAVLVRPASGQTWPLVETAPVKILGNSTKIVQVLLGAVVETYGIGVTFEVSGSQVCSQEVGPSIIVTAPGIPK